MEQRAYAAIAQRDALEQQRDQAKHHRQGRALAQRLARALRLAEEVHTLTHWMQPDTLALAGPDTPTRQTLYDFVMERLQALEALDAPRLRPVRRTRVHQRDILLAFATRLDWGLETLAQRFAVPVLRLRQILALPDTGSHPARLWISGGCLAAPAARSVLCDRALLELRHRLPRASSPVENLHRRLRTYCFLRRPIGPPYLDL